MNGLRELQILSESTAERKAKKNAIESIKKQMNSQANLVEFFSLIYKQVLRSLADKVESVRETAAEIILSGCVKIVDLDPFLPYIMSVLVQRIGLTKAPQSNETSDSYNSLAASDMIYQQNLVESSEEVRLILIKIASEIVNKKSLKSQQNIHYMETGVQNVIMEEESEQVSTLLMYIPDLVSIVLTCIADPYSEVKKEACFILQQLAINSPTSVSMFISGINRAVLANFLHKHSNVRVASIMAFGSVVEADAAALEESSTIDLLKKIVHDKSTNVREAFYKVLGSWFLNLKDRYGFASKLLALFLSGFNDSSSSVRNICSSFMDKIGALYEYDWEDRVKDQLDFLPNSMFPDRPRIGARELVRDNIQKTLKSLTEDIDGWTFESQLVGLQTINTLMIYAEGYITGYSNDVILNIMKFINSTDTRLSSSAFQCAKTLSKFVELSVLIRVLRTFIELNRFSVNSLTNAIVVLNAILLGLDSNQKFIVGLDEVLDVLMCFGLDKVEDPKLLDVLFVLYSDILDIFDQYRIETNNSSTGIITEEQGFKLFSSIIYLLSSSDQFRNISFTKKPDVNRLGSILNTDMSSLYQLYLCDRMIPIWKQECSNWTSSTSEFRFFIWIMKYAGIEILSNKNMIQDVVFCLFKNLANGMCEKDCRTNEIDMDWNIRSVVLDLLLNLVNRNVFSFIQNLTENEGQKLFQVLLEEIVMPNLVWRSGRKAESVRCKSMKLFLSILQNSVLFQSGIPVIITHLIPKENENSINQIQFSSLWSLLISCLEDDLVQTREETIQTFTCLFSTSEFYSYFQQNMELNKKLYLEFIKRFDDAIDELRILMAVCFRLFCKNCLSKNLDEIHYQTIIDGLLVHIDDQNSAIQEAVSLILIDAVSNKEGALSQNLIFASAKSALSKHRSSVFLDRVLEFC